jgi:hypothetical protein
LLTRELADQIYSKKEELDQERMEEIQEIQEKQVEDILKREERINDLQENTEREFQEIQNIQGNRFENVFGSEKQDFEELMDSGDEDPKGLRGADGDLIRELMVKDELKAEKKDEHKRENMQDVRNTSEMDLLSIQVSLET